MPERNKNLLIGLFVLGGILIIIYMILFIHPTTGNLGQTLHVRFADIDKVNVGTRVLLAGHPVGEVSEVRIVDNARCADNIHDHEVYLYELTLKIDSRVKVYETDEIIARTSGLLGERSVSISPRLPPITEPLIRVTEKDILYAAHPPSVDDAIREFNKLSEKAQRAIGKINEALDILQKQHLWENVSATASNLKEITDALNRPEDLDEIITNILTLSEALVDLEKKVAKTWNTVDDTVEDVHDIVAHVKKGEGTVGRLLIKEDLYLRLTSVMNRANTLMDDINHYGLLFHNDKSWQRLRARRVNLLSKLSSPTEFRNYFSDEMNQISTSISRVSMVLQEANQYDAVCSPEFVNVFTDLLKRIEGLANDIKLYDQQVMEIRDKECQRRHLPFECLPN